jgi:alkaline phosphatase D
MKRRRFLTPLSLLTAALLAGAAAPAGSAEFQSDWPPRGERIWVGPGLWANRLQDWRVVDGRLECLEGRPGKPMRTVHLLTHRPDPRGGKWNLRVEIGGLNQGSPYSRQAAAGFLIGAGGNVDPRAAALVHHSWGKGAGIFAGPFKGADPTANAAAERPRRNRNWKIMHVDSEEAGSPASNAIDGDPATIWHTAWKQKKPTHPHEIQIDLGEVRSVNSVRYTPRQDNVAGRIKDFEIYASEDPNNWGAPVSHGNLPDSTQPQHLVFNRVAARYIRLVALSAHAGRPSTTVADLDVFDTAEGRAAPVSPGLPGVANRNPFGRIVLHLSVNRTASTHLLTLAAIDMATGERISQVEWREAPADRLADNLALVSHPGASSGRFSFRNWRVDGPGIIETPEHAAGPILGTQYTVHNNVLKLTAQMMPVGNWDNRTVRLQTLDGRAWRTIATTGIIAPGWTAPFRIPDWDAARDTRYRVLYQWRTQDSDLRDFTWEGTIRKDPVEKPVIVVAGFTGNHNTRGSVDRGRYEWTRNGLWFPHTDITSNVAKHKPDLLFFSGDQVYEGASPTAAIRGRGETTMLDYLYKWYLFSWAYRDLTRDIPTITIPDDHDVYQGNVWGRGGRRTDKDDKGGYVESAAFVKMVERTQTSHLPDPYDPTPVDQGIGVYYAPLNIGRVSVAIIEDRKFKWGPNGVVPPTDTGRADHVNDPNFNPKTADVPGAQLLGQRQERFLREWAADWTGADMKMVVSQTIFGNLATHHGGKLGYLVADYDSNGWPQSGRARALHEMRRGFAFMLGGDQHLSTIVHHGIDGFDDAGWSFCVPSIANFYPRAWNPPNGRAVKDDAWPADMPDYTGRFHDGFGNHVTVYAATNPGKDMGHEPKSLHDRMPGYGIVKLNKRDRTITMENWPRFSDPANKKTAVQYDGWPKTIRQTDNYGRKPEAWLPTIKVSGMQDPVVQLTDSDSGETVYTLRINGTEFRPWTFAKGHYDIRVGEPETDTWQIRKRLRAHAENDAAIRLEF